MMTKRLLLCTVCALAVVLVASAAVTPGRAFAQDRDDFYYPSHVSLELHAGFSWWGDGLAAGARLGIPVASGWLSQSIANTFSLTLGGDFYFIRNASNGAYAAGLGIPITLEWKVHFVPLLSLFAELGVNIFLPNALLRSSQWDYPGAWFVGAIGLEIHVSRGFSIVARLGSPYSSLGIAFAL